MPAPWWHRGPVAAEEFCPAGVPDHPRRPPRHQRRTAIEDLAQRDRDRGFAHALHQRGPYRARGHWTDGHQDRVEARLYLCRTGDTGRRRSPGPTGTRYGPGGGRRLSKTAPNIPADDPRRRFARGGSLVRTAGHGTPAPVTDRASF